MLTTHAVKRLRQRGIAHQVIDLLLMYGRARHDHRRAEIIYFDRTSRRILERECGKAMLSLGSKLFGCYAVIGEAGQIVTVGHRTRRMNAG